MSSLVNNPIVDRISSAKGKGGSQQPAPMQAPAPTAPQPMDPAARQALLAQMIARSRAGAMPTGGAGA
jgi:hypothetical protein